MEVRLPCRFKKEVLYEKNVHVVLFGGLLPFSFRMRRRIAFRYPEQGNDGS